jgi:hypothetical protein
MGDGCPFCGRPGCDEECKLDQRSNLLPIDGFTLNLDLNAELKQLWLNGDVRCRWCGSEVHGDSFQVHVYNNGLMATPLPDNHPMYEMESLSPAEQTLHIYCGCGDACMARDMAFGLEHLKKLGVLD